MDNLLFANIIKSIFWMKKCGGNRTEISTLIYDVYKVLEESIVPKGPSKRKKLYSIKSHVNFHKFQ